MNDLTVTCGCGRRMTLDSLRGRGAYRCGCGSRMKVQEPAYQAEMCVTAIDGHRCRKTPVTECPVLLCKQHLNDLKASAGLIKPEELPEYADRLVAARMAHSRGPDFDQDDWLERFAQRQAAAEAERASKVDFDRKAIERQLDPYSVVYFIRMGDLIKIGYTNNLQKRVYGLSLTMVHVIATVFGGSAVEEELHERFADLREHGEWFRAEPPLLDYIDEIKPNRRVS